MIRLAILLVLATNLANGQLNYEGNPFTEYTEYIAEESNLSEKSARQNDAPVNVASSDVSLRPQKLYPVMEAEADRQLQQAAETNNLLSDKSQRQIPFSFQVTRPNATFGRQMQDLPDQKAPISTAEVALSNFLNSKTPEESRASLDYYLRSQQSPEDQSHSLNAINDPNKQSLVQLDGQLVSQTGQQQMLLPRQEQQMQLTSQINQAQLMPHIVPQPDQRQQFLSAGQTYNYVGQPAVIQPMIRAPTGVVLGQGMLQPVPLMTPSFQARNDMITSAMWRERMRRIRGKPFVFAQPKIAPGLYKGPITGKFPKLNPITIERERLECERIFSFDPRIVTF